MSPEFGRSLRWMLGLVMTSAALVSVSAARAEADGALDRAAEVTAVVAPAAGEQDSPEEPGVLDPDAVRQSAAGPGDPGERPEAEPEVAKETDDYDPWQSFNERMFSFNRSVDRYALKPVATLWDNILPDPVEQSLKKAFDNLAMPRRLVNNILQLKLKGAGRELARFGLNTTVGIGGLFDVAKRLGLEPSDADTGQTLGRWGVRSGPYLVLPFMPPLTVRDGIGYVVDLALDPFNYVIFPVAALAGLGVGKRVDERALNLDLYETVEGSTVDLYSAVRNAYLQRRQNAIEKERDQ